MPYRPGQHPATILFYKIFTDSEYGMQDKNQGELAENWLQDSHSPNRKNNMPASRRRVLGTSDKINGILCERHIPILHRPWNIRTNSDGFAAYSPERNGTGVPAAKTESFLVIEVIFALFTYNNERRNGEDNFHGQSSEKEIFFNCTQRVTRKPVFNSHMFLGARRNPN